jgi:hypothetical protein
MKTAIVTASYSGDFERCRLLCESIDRRVSGYTFHYILVEPADVELFRQLAGPKRVILDERELLPSWLRVVPDPTRLGRRRLWISTRGLPLRGWHVQQLRKIAFAARMEEDGALFCDSDTVLVRETDVSEQWDTEGRLAFYRKPRGISLDMAEHRIWASRAGTLLGIDPQQVSDTDYIAQSVSWRSDTAREMVGRIEDTMGRSWVSAVAARRRFSECLIYGRFVDEVENRPDRHLKVETSVCHSYWMGSALDAQHLRSFIQTASPQQPMVGIQSFIGTDVALIRQLTGLA